MATEDVAIDPAAVRATALAVRSSVSQISAGRKNSLQWEIDGSTGAAAWDSETPDHLWLGHRDRPNEILLTQPGADGSGRAAPRPRCRPATSRGSPTRSARCSGPIYADVAPGHRPTSPPYATFADGHDEMLVGDAIAESARLGRWVDVDRTARASPADAGGPRR